MHLLAEAIAEFARLLEAARMQGDPEPTAMILASADPDGRISARTVLLKEVDARGFVFYTNYESNKGRQLQSNPRAALLFLWKSLAQQVQVKVEGRVEQLSHAEADAYFATRPRGSQIGAWASKQSQDLPQRQDLLDRIAQFEQQFAGNPVPRPEHWSGFRVLPDMIEIWHGKPFRLHERTRYECTSGHWAKRELYP
jgi:pyridoxamine 5'-phosphate oxidase